MLGQALERLVQAPGDWVQVSESIAQAQAQGQAKALLVPAPALEQQILASDLQSDATDSSDGLQCQ